MAKGLQALKDGEEEFHRQVAESERYLPSLIGELERAGAATKSDGWLLPV
jgi:hypothetical protein